MNIELIPDLHLTISIRFDVLPATMKEQADKSQMVEELATGFYWDFVGEGMRSRSSSLGELDEDYSFALLLGARKDGYFEIIEAEFLIFTGRYKAGANEKDYQDKITGWFGSKIEITFLDNQGIRFSEKTLQKLRQHAGCSIVFRDFKYFIDTKDNLLIRILYGGTGYFCSSSSITRSSGRKTKDLEKINDAFYHTLLELGMKEAKDHRLGGQEDSFMCEVVDNYEVLELQVPFKRGIGTFGENLHKNLATFFGPGISFEFDEHTRSFRFPERTRKLFNERSGYYLNIERVEICFAH